MSKFIIPQKSGPVSPGNPCLLLIIIQCTLILLSGCSSIPDAFTPFFTTTPPQITQNIHTPSPTTSPTSTVTASPHPATLPPTPTITNTPEPFGCLRPPDDYQLVTVNGYLINRRTLAMLEQASKIYTGEIDILGYALTQGSYTTAVEASFGTHAGGGAVDLSVMRQGTYTILWEEIPRLIQALRLAGFAAWLRELDELHPGSPIHIHAIAIGDRDLSPAASNQLDGPAGYFRGFSGLPSGSNLPSLDRHGGPQFCSWMLELGYTDLRPTPTALAIEDENEFRCKCQPQP